MSLKRHTVWSIDGVLLPFTLKWLQRERKITRQVVQNSRNCGHGLFTLQFTLLSMCNM